MKILRDLFLENKAWVVEKIQNNPRYFIETSKDQTPSYLWIGCSDSRVLPNEITGTSVGDLFVHRNIANLVHPEDLNLMSVVTYAVRYLKVKHVIVCGHYGCGGVKAAMGDGSFGLIDQWLKNIKDVQKKYIGEIKNISDPNLQFDRMVELNVVQQVEHLKKSSVMQELIKENPKLTFHGWVYDLKSGYIKDVWHESNHPN